MSEILYKYVKGKGWIPEDTSRGVYNTGFTVSPTNRYFFMVYLPNYRGQRCQWIKNNNNVYTLDEANTQVVGFLHRHSHYIKTCGWDCRIDAYEKHNW